MPDDPICSRCSKPVRRYDHVERQHGELFHIRCESAVLGLRSYELQETSRELLAQAQEAVAQSERLVAPRRLARLAVLISGGMAASIWRSISAPSSSSS